MRVAAVALLVAVAVAGCFEIGPSSVRPRDYLTSDSYQKWVIEVDYAATEKPSTALTRFLHDRLAPLVHKDSIEVRLGESLEGNTDTSWSDGDVQSFAREHRNVETGMGTVATHVLFLAGHSSHDTDDGRVLGIAYGHDLIVIFSQSIKNACTLPAPLCSPETYFQAVLVHEFGHVLGLVDNGVPMVRDHEADTCGSKADEGHSINQNSVMYCQVETSAITLLSKPPTDFDVDDKADLRAAGGK